MATIGIRTIEAVSKQLKTVLMDHRNEIDEAFCKDDSKKAFPVGLKAIFAPGKNGGIKHFAKIDFVFEKISDESIAEETDENAPAGSKGALFDHADADRARRRRILFRDFRPFARFLEARDRERRVRAMVEATGSPLWKSFN